MKPVLPDIQKTQDVRNVAINRVGVTNVKLPITVRCPGDRADIRTVGKFELSVSLPHDVKGTHMSRFTEVLNAHIEAGGAFSLKDLQSVVRELAAKLGATSCFVQMSCEYFVDQFSPATGKRGTAPVDGFIAVNLLADGTMKCATGVQVLGKTCCPCSREISDYDHETGKGKGAHAQRGLISITAEHGAEHTVWFEELVRVAWQAFSQPVYPVLKRPDERAVTVGAYENPKFVEDVIRDVTTQMRELAPVVTAFTVRVQNAESIHYHDAYAEVSETFGA